MPKQRFPEAEKRLFQRVFICLKCGAKMRTDAPKVKAGKVNCRHCRSTQLRAIHKDHK